MAVEAHDSVNPDIPIMCRYFVMNVVLDVLDVHSNFHASIHQTIDLRLWINHEYEWLLICWLYICYFYSFHNYCYQFHSIIWILHIFQSTVAVVRSQDEMCKLSSRALNKEVLYLNRLTYHIMRFQWFNRYEICVSEIYSQRETFQEHLFG